MNMAESLANFGGNEFKLYFLMRPVKTMTSTELKHYTLHLVNVVKIKCQTDELVLSGFEIPLR